MRRLAAYVHTLTFEQRFLCVLAMVLLIWCLTDVRMRGRVDPNNPLAHKTDFTCYTVAADALWHGADPYQVKNIRGWGYPYPPLLAVAVMPLLWLDP